MLNFYALNILTNLFSLHCLGLFQRYFTWRQVFTDCHLSWGQMYPQHNHITVIRECAHVCSYNIWLLVFNSPRDKMFFLGIQVTDHSDSRGSVEIIYLFVFAFEQRICRLFVPTICSCFLKSFCRNSTRLKLCHPLLVLYVAFLQPSSFFPLCPLAA